ncbi:MAG: hypothetical protein R3C12_14015 [Planctomycetaceae bacterium]
MKSSVKLIASVVVLAIFTGMLVTDADAGRRCRRARRCYTLLLLHELLLHELLQDHLLRTEGLL